MSQLHWVTSGNYSYAFSPEGTILVADRDGNQLKEVPQQAMKSDVYQRMSQAIRINAEMSETDGGHAPLAPAVNRTLRTWMTGEAALQASDIIRHWGEPEWSKGLENLVVRAGGKTGFLTDIRGNTFHLLSRKGRSRTINVGDHEGIELPHPTTLRKFEQWKETAQSLGIKQGYRQLERPIFRYPFDMEEMEKQLTSYAGGRWFRNGPDSRLDALCAMEGMDIEENQIIAAYPNGDGTSVRLVVDCFDAVPGQLTTMLFFFEDENGEPLSHVTHAVYSESVRTAMILKARADQQLDTPRF